MAHTRDLDNTLELLADPYRFISTQSAELGADVFEARILLENTLCMRGAEAARLFYDDSRFTRSNAAPEPVLATLFGKEGVQTLDGAAHHARKALFLSLLTPHHIGVMTDLAIRHWDIEAERGEPGARPLYEYAQRVLGRAACAWVGLLVSDEEAESHVGDLVHLFDSAARGVRPHIRARRSRKRLEEGLCRLIESERNLPEELQEIGTALHAIATHRQADGSRLAPNVAAVELLNLLRPTVAVSVYIVWMAHALQAYPDLAARLRSDADYILPFVQEVRRYYPFFPAVVARVRKDFEWAGMKFVRGQRVLLDLYGTNHDGRIWVEPEAFNPDRFLQQTPDEYEFIPQGGGDAAHGHRCPGEGLTIALMQALLPRLIAALPAADTPADLSIDDRRLPALPKRPILI